MIQAKDELVRRLKQEQDGHSKTAGQQKWEAGSTSPSGHSKQLEVHSKDKQWKAVLCFECFKQGNTDVICIFIKSPWVYIENIFQGGKGRSRKTSQEATAVVQTKDDGGLGRSGGNEQNGQIWDRF